MENEIIENNQTNVWKMKFKKESVEQIRKVKYNKKIKNY